MTDEEALKFMEDQVLLEAHARAREALREKVAAKKPKRPTLNDIEEWLRNDCVCESESDHNCGIDCSIAQSAADLIKAVREDTVKELKRLYYGAVMSRKVSWEMDGLTAEAWALARLRALGEDA